MVLVALLCLVCVTRVDAASLRVALHAQSRSEVTKVVAGSEITIQGLQRAFDDHPSVSLTRVFAPAAYDGLNDEDWDLVLIEGWAGSVPRFINEIRREARRRGRQEPLVLFFCLDIMPTIEAVQHLDVDGYLTNSRVLERELADIAPTRYVALAADPEIMRPVKVDERYAHAVTYLGQMSLSKTHLRPMLEEVAPLGLAIYGYGWDHIPSLAPYWRGILPKGDIAKLYSSARLVLSTTEEVQERLGMVNNRFFEALACGALVLTPTFPELEETLGGYVAYFNTTDGAALQAATSLLSQGADRGRVREARRRFVVQWHTWHHRVSTILDFHHTLAQATLTPRQDRLESLPDSQVDEPLWKKMARRSNMPRLSVITTPHGRRYGHSEANATSWQEHVLAQLYESESWRVTEHAWEDDGRLVQQLCRVSEWVAVLADDWGQEAARALRTADCMTDKHWEARKVLIVRGPLPQSGREELREYSAIVVVPGDHTAVPPSSSSHPRVVSMEPWPAPAHGSHARPEARRKRRAAAVGSSFVGEPLSTMAGPVAGAAGWEAGREPASLLAAASDGPDVMSGQCNSPLLAVESALLDALHTPMPNARLVVTSPRDGEVITASGAGVTIDVSIDLAHLTLPVDGYWCVKAQDEDDHHDSDGVVAVCAIGPQSRLPLSINWSDSRQPTRRKLRVWAAVLGGESLTRPQELVRSTPVIIFVDVVPFGSGG